MWLDDNYDVRQVRGHYEIYCGGRFIGSADNQSEINEIIEGERTNDTTKF